ncbi:uncharacterized protein LTR77_000788 [Saxophila tyrrhenica]|uniref:Zn(2)-C6 fungal-type domain-containing protein n=1 Tax=Saxophila tyrrhenica TaxID=1690608 RepID=A0AAV9PP06_9PEZI|nr:hypothetical protein LTR77_000788 [Saxophila tyrrhenica]
MQVSNCDRCYRRKGRCDKKQPCSTCSRGGVPCTYSDRTKERRYTADHVERLERKIRQAEARNHELTDELQRTKVSHRGSAADGHEPTADGPSTARSVDPVSEVSYLSINAAGERQPYLGSTSGVLFASLVRNSVNVPQSRQASPPPHGPLEDVTAAAGTASLRKLEDLPSRSLVNRLFSAYLDHDALIYPFLAPSFLLETTEKLYADPTYYASAASAFEVFVFHMILAISTTQCFKHDWQMLPGAEMHHACAMKELNPVMASGGIQSLQAILLLCQFRTGSSVKDNSASMWHLVGIASRSCLELGLHRESTYTMQPSTDLEPHQLEVYRKQETARRCFWSVIAMDRICSQILGRPLAIRDEDVDALLPSSSYDTVITRPLAAKIAGVSRIRIFNHVITYRLLCGRLLSTLHRKRAPEMTVADAMNVRDKFAAELEKWNDGSKDLGLSDSTDTASRQQSCYLSKVWYEVLYANAALMIWRPSPLLADITHDQPMLQKIFDSATHAVNTYSALHKSRQINYSWVTLQSIFMAGLSYIYAVSRHMREARQPTTSKTCLLAQDPSTIEIINVTRACSNVLVAVAERWSVLRHCHEVFDRLSDAVLADAIKLQTSPAAVAHTTPVQQSHLHHAHQNNTGLAANNTQSEQLQLWNPAPYPVPDYPDTLHPSPLAVDNEFLHCFDDLQQLYNHQQLEDPVMHLSQDWMAYLGGPYDANAYGNHMFG